MKDFRMKAGGRLYKLKGTSLQREGKTRGEEKTKQDLIKPVKGSRTGRGEGAWVKDTGREENLERKVGLLRLEMSNRKQTVDLNKIWGEDA